MRVLMGPVRDAECPLLTKIREKNYQWRLLNLNLVPWNQKLVSYQFATLTPNYQKIKIVKIVESCPTQLQTNHKSENLDLGVKAGF